MKTCTKCNNEYDESFFHFKGKKSDGRLHSECKSCFRERMKYRVSTQLEKIKQLAGDSCKVCGYNKCDAALEFHHLDPNEKDFNISKSRSRSLNKIAEEIKKCVLLCANCHREVHAGILKLGV